ncbi:PAS domain-containing protein [Gilvimarinus agarilyticus]|uniref:sensor histidine kinase n=1 Tax=unclassified Gilvimarinus TaxID=2642066 RepID=UPI001C09002F|nr:MULTISPECIES: ATP-binding protein [unclassified Gilvimarinus]MBU2887241.1 PAS domain-containing protein [Gilvimarinus agarilyticus]MDO6571900.1 ATP-binding protein [Gilvimarinus sp. 2_MG-2023]MDO6745969.1 ATP-binding protein [Gilvimarinus sp. 1_MG-2023]
MAKKAEVHQLPGHPGAESTHKDKAQALAEAFSMFSDMSEQLTDSYRQLELRVAELNEELTEVTHQRLQELAEKERIAHRLEGLLNVLPGGVVVLDSRGYVRECNPAAIDLLGEPLEGELWRVVIARSFAPKQDDGHEVSLSDGRRISLATRNLGDDGQIILLTDQTETRRLQGELAKHERLSALGKMVSALAHQIRTPLSAALLYANHLKRDNLTQEKRQGFAGKVSNRLLHMERQVQDMLLFVKGELPVQDLCSVAELQAELAEAMEVPVSSSNSCVEWNVQGVNAYLHCNRDALVSALLNLVNNAIQAVGSRAKIGIRFNQFYIDQRPWLAIEIRDSGPGIDPQLLPTLGDLFVTTKSQGTGLGIAVVKAVAKVHGGRFRLQSELGDGVKATLLLPCDAEATVNS